MPFSRFSRAFELGVHLPSRPASHAPRSLRVLGRGRLHLAAGDLLDAVYAGLEILDMPARKASSAASGAVLAIDPLLQVARVLVRQLPLELQVAQRSPRGASSILSLSSTAAPDSRSSSTLTISARSAASAARSAAARRVPPCWRASASSRAAAVRSEPAALRMSPSTRARAREDGGVGLQERRRVGGEVKVLAGERGAPSCRGFAASTGSPKTARQQSGDVLRRAARKEEGLDAVLHLERDVGRRQHDRAGPKPGTRAASREAGSR
jgi:hypothetical protein